MRFSSLLETSTWPLIFGLYVVATWCFTQYLSKRVLNWWLQKYFSPSLMIGLGVPNRIKMFFFRNLSPHVHYWKVKQQLLSILKHNQLPLECTDWRTRMERGPWNLYPTYQTVNFKDVVERHLVTSRTIFHPLTCITCLNISISILKQLRPIKSWS